jgi:hypothetical protein
MIDKIIYRRDSETPLDVSAAIADGCRVSYLSLEGSRGWVTTTIEELREILAAAEAEERTAESEGAQ